MTNFLNSVAAFLRSLPARIARVKKMVIPVIASVAGLLSLPVFTGLADKVGLTPAAVAGIVGVLVALGIYVPKNTPPAV